MGGWCDKGMRSGVGSIKETPVRPEPRVDLSPSTIQSLPLYDLQ